MTLAERVVELASQPDLSPAEFGELNTLLGRHVNTASPKLTDYLYSTHHWGFPPRYIKEGTRNTTRLARDTDALLSLKRHYPDDRKLDLCLLLSNRRTQLETLGCSIDADGRIRYAVNIVGTETQRHTCHSSNTGSGYNLHTTQPEHKHLFLADDGCDLWNVDLGGADGWTIGAECAALGDIAMLTDLQMGLKPAQAVWLLYKFGTEANRWDYPKLLAEAKKIDKNGWEYMAFKKGIWGTCYGMGEQKQIDVIADESYKETGTPLFVDVHVVRAMRKCVLERYPGILRRQARINMQLERDGFLCCANGSRREFLGNPRDHATQKEAYGHHPQVVTTWVTSLAWRKMWYDPENVLPTSERIAMPFLLVHDSILFQAPIDRRDWVREKLAVWFDNPVTIAGRQIRIPYSAGFGPTWAHACGLL